MASFGLNVVSFLLLSGARRWYVVGAYALTKDAPAMHYVEQLLRAAPNGLDKILTGDLKGQLGESRDGREEGLVTTLVDRGLFNMTDHFMPQRWYRGASTCT